MQISEKKQEPHINSIIRFRIKSFKKAGHVIYMVKKWQLKLNFTETAKAFKIHQYTLKEKTKWIIAFSHWSAPKIVDWVSEILDKTEEIASIFKKLKKDKKEAIQGYFLYLLSLK